MKKKDTGLEFKVGLFVLIALLALGYLSLRLGEETISAQKTYPVSAIFDDVSGLTTGATVKMAGVEIGRVSSIGLSNGKALVQMSIYKDVKISKDALATIRTEGVLGDRYIEIRQGESSETLKPGGFIAKTQPPMDLETLITEVGPVVKDVRAITRSLREAVEGSDLKTMITNLSQASASLRVVADKMAKGEGTLGRLLVEDTIYKHLETTAANLDQIVADVKAGKGTLGHFLVDDSMYNELEKLVATTQEAADNLNEISQSLSSGKGTLGKLLMDETLYNRLASAATRLDEISQRLATGQGTLGKLLTDDSLYDEIKQAVINVNRAAVGAQEVLPTTVLGTIGSAVLQ